MQICGILNKLCAHHHQFIWNLQEPGNNPNCIYTEVREPTQWAMLKLWIWGDILFVQTSCDIAHIISIRLQGSDANITTQERFKSMTCSIINTKYQQHRWKCMEFPTLSTPMGKRLQLQLWNTINTLLHFWQNPQFHSKNQIYFALLLG